MLTRRSSVNPCERLMAKLDVGTDFASEHNRTTWILGGSSRAWLSTSKHLVADTIDGFHGHHLVAHRSLLENSVLRYLWRRRLDQVLARNTARIDLFCICCVRSRTLDAPRGAVNLCRALRRVPTDVHIVNLMVKDCR